MAGKRNRSFKCKCCYFGGCKRNTRHLRTGPSNRMMTRSRSNCRRAGTKVSSPSKSRTSYCRGSYIHHDQLHTGQLPAATRQVANALNAKGTLIQQRVQAVAFYSFLDDPHKDLRDLNGDDSTVFTALGAVPNSNLVKVVYESQCSD